MPGRRGRVELAVDEGVVGRTFDVAEDAHGRQVRVLGREPRQGKRVGRVGGVLVVDDDAGIVRRDIILDRQPTGG